LGLESRSGALAAANRGLDANGTLPAVAAMQQISALVLSMFSHYLLFDPEKQGL
jgi:hypothetical protein